jgi:hypothetical protein
MSVKVIEIPQSMTVNVRRSLGEQIADFIAEGARSGHDIVFEIRKNTMSTQWWLEISTHSNGLVLTVEGEAIDE